MNLGQNTFLKNKQTRSDSIVTMSKYNLGEGNKFQTWKNSISEIFQKLVLPLLKEVIKGPNVHSKLHKHK